MFKLSTISVTACPDLFDHLTCILMKNCSVINLTCSIKNLWRSCLLCPSCNHTPCFSRNIVQNWLPWSPDLSARFPCVGLHENMVYEHKRWT